MPCLLWHEFFCHTASSSWRARCCRVSYQSEVQQIQDVLQTGIFLILPWVRFMCHRSQKQRVTTKSQSVQHIRADTYFILADPIQVQSDSYCYHYDTILTILSSIFLYIFVHYQFTRFLLFIAWLHVTLIMNHGYSDPTSMFCRFSTLSDF